ncbi:hypothetical protein [Streptomyces sp. CB01881]|uniref:hypothetical protein n=1 Tax=Streptomyces sp. CB01881 TaxID=2078691 RepID=UPI0011E053C7|nr:hypothetical protein [Streptomyces sp. CB01881]TYC68805.1 hypothetical protein EH183_38815 [Streptomyces sp. CB01881]
MTVTPGEPLPLHLPRDMQVWSYQVSHRTLLFRSFWQSGDSTVTEIEFVSVLGMKTRSSYRGLTVREVAADPEIDRLLNLPEGPEPRYRRLHLLSDGVPAGFVVCGAVRVREVPTGH